MHSAWQSNVMKTLYCPQRGSTLKLDAGKTPEKKKGERNEGNGEEYALSNSVFSFIVPKMSLEKVNFEVALKGEEQDSITCVFSSRHKNLTNKKPAENSNQKQN